MRLKLIIPILILVGIPTLWWLIAIYIIPDAPRALTILLVSAVGAGILGALLEIQRQAKAKPNDWAKRLLALMGVVLPIGCLLVGWSSIQLARFTAPEPAGPAAATNHVGAQPHSELPPMWRQNWQAVQLDTPRQRGWTFSDPAHTEVTYDPRNDDLKFALCVGGLRGWRYDYHLLGEYPGESSRFGVYGTITDALHRENWLPLYEFSPGVLKEAEVMYVQRRADAPPLGTIMTLAFKHTPLSKTATAVMLGHRGIQPGVSYSLGKIWNYPATLPKHRQYRLEVDVFIMATQPGGQPMDTKVFAKTPSVIGLDQRVQDWIAPTYFYSLEPSEKNPELAIACSIPCWLFVNIIVRDVVPLPDTI